MDDDVISMICSHCGTEHVMDDSGEFVSTGKRKSKHSINNSMVRAEHADGEDWQQELYKAREPKAYVPPKIMLSINETAATPINNPALKEANNQDLQKRNIKTTNDKLNND